MTCNDNISHFSSKYIEDITTKTGNFKKYSVFVKMLFSSLSEDSSSVFLDLLTYDDLESLKSRAGAASKAGRAPPPAGTVNKRYIILTYAAEFDRVHYPLPLLYEDNPDPQLMRDWGFLENNSKYGKYGKRKWVNY